MGDIMAKTLEKWGLHEGMLLLVVCAESSCDYGERESPSDPQDSRNPKTRMTTPSP